MEIKYYRDLHLFRIEDICQICRRHFLKLHIHHIDGNQKNNEVNNLIFLCSNCYRSIHSLVSFGFAIKKKGRLRDYNSSLRKDVRNRFLINYYKKIYFNNKEIKRGRIRDE